MRQSKPLTQLDVSGFKQAHIKWGPSERNVAERIERAAKKDRRKFSAMVKILAERGLDADGD